MALLLTAVVRRCNTSFLGTSVQGILILESLSEFRWTDGSLGLEPSFSGLLFQEDPNRSLPNLEIAIARARFLNCVDCF